MKGIRGILLLSSGCLAISSGSVFAVGYEWIQAIPAAWATNDAAQNLPVTVIEGQAITGGTQAIIKPGGTISQWTDAMTETDPGEGTIMSADQECIYEVDLEQLGVGDKPPQIERIDLWNDNSSEARNAVNVEIQVSYDGSSFETVLETGNNPGTKPKEETCNLMTFDLSSLTKPVKKIRIVDKVAITSVRGAQSPLWLEWDLVAKSP